MTILKNFLVFLLLFMAGILLGTFVARLKSPMSEILSPTPRQDSKPGLVLSEETIQPLPFEDLKDDLLSLLASRNGTWGIVIKDLNTSRQLFINEDSIFHGASLTKVLTAVTILDKIEKNQESLSRKIQEETIETLLATLINRSDNRAWQTLNAIAGFNNMQTQGESLGMNNLNVYENELTPKDVATLLESLYYRKVLNEKNRQFLFTLMQDTETEDRLPAGVPEDLKIVHRSGTLDEYLHDAGIVFYDRPYILVVMGKNTNREEGTAAIKEVSATVYKYFKTL